jgi:hypothetical protein
LILNVWVSCKSLGLLPYVFDVQEIWADLNLIANAQGFRFIKGYYSTVKCGRARSAQANKVEVAFHLTDAGMKPRDLRVIEPYVGIGQSANLKAFADDRFRIDRTIFAYDYECALLYGAHLVRKHRAADCRGRANAGPLVFTKSITALLGLAFPLSYSEEAYLNDMDHQQR